MEVNKIKNRIEKKTKEIEDLEDQIFNIKKLEKLKKDLNVRWVKKIFFYDDHTEVLIGSIDDDDNTLHFIYYKDFTQKELQKIYLFLLSQLSETAVFLKKKIASFKDAILK